MSGERSGASAGPGDGLSAGFRQRYERPSEAPGRDLVGRVRCPYVPGSSRSNLLSSANLEVAAVLRVTLFAHLATMLWVPRRCQRHHARRFHWK